MPTKGSGVLQLRVPADVRARWQTAADLRGITLSEWVRHTCDKAVGMGGVPTVARRPKGARVVAVCERRAFHRSGVYCKTCGVTPT